MSKMSDMTEYHASAYRLPSGFEHCSKLKPVAEAATALDRVKAVVDVQILEQRLVRLLAVDRKSVV